MKQISFSLMAAACLLASCSSDPTMKLADGSFVNLGFSFLENTSKEGAKYTAANGTSLEYSKENKNQTTGAGQIVGFLGTAAAIKGATAQLGGNNAADVAKARLR